MRFKVDELAIDPDARFKRRGRKHRLKKKHVKYWLQRQPRAADGSIRALASRYLPGRPIGQFRHYGTRTDDPNDIFGHHRRRELRGYRVFAAWLNHNDSRAPNTFDSFVEVDGQRFIRHYLLDFGANLGSASTHPQLPRAGNEYYLDLGQMTKGMLTLGLWARPWMKVDYEFYPSVGNYEADFFRPEQWRPHYPNPAFKRMDAADAFWGAKLVAEFTDEILRAIVGEAEISDPRAEAHVLDVLIRRRDKVVRYWIARTNPVDEFKLSTTHAGTSLAFDNAAIRLGAATGAPTYTVKWSRLDNLNNVEDVFGQETIVTGRPLYIPNEAWGPKDDAGFRYAIAEIKTMHSDHPHWAVAVKVTVRDRAGDMDIVGIERPREDLIALP